MVPSELMSWADFLAKVGQFLFGLCTIVLAFWAVIFKRKELFRTELTKKQLNELGAVRTALQSVLFDFFYIPITAQTMRTMGWNLDVLKEQDPDSWQQYQRYKNTSTELFYKFSDAHYYLFPDWIDKDRRLKFADAMRRFAPFTFVAASSKSKEEREAYVREIAEMKEHIDVRLRRYG